MSDVPIISGYHLIQRIGSGAFGAVWLAQEKLTPARRAVKVLQKQAVAGAGSVARELAGIREYQRKSTGHPSLVQIQHVDENDGAYYYAMELADNIAADGQSYRPATLAERISREAPMPAQSALEITAQLLRGVAHLHQRDLLHRDIKPVNVLICDGRVKLGDVSLLTTLDRDVTVCGTPGYIPPRDATLDCTADLYAVGIILYEMITGLHRSKFPELPVLKPQTRAERRALHAAIRIANKAAHPDRKQRYSTADAMLHDVETGRAPRKDRRRQVATAAVVAGIIAAMIWWRPAAAPAPPPVAQVYPVVAAKVKDHTQPHLLTLTLADASEWPVDFRECPALHELKGQIRVRSAVTADFVADGRKELVVGLDCGANEPGILAYDAARPDTIPREPVHVWSGGFKQPPWTHQVFTKLVAVLPEWAGDLDGEPGDELVVAIIHPDGPSRWVVFTRDWRILGQYWHYGQMSDVKAANLFGDPKKELICFGLANELEGPPATPGEPQHEPGHLAVLVIDPFTASDDGAWSMNEWMNVKSQWTNVTPRPPLAYGFVRYFSDDPDNPGWSYESQESVTLHLESNEPLRLALERKLELRFDRQLRLLRIQQWGIGKSQGPAENDLDKVWCRLWPKDDQPGAVVKDRQASAEQSDGGN